MPATSGADDEGGEGRVPVARGSGNVYADLGMPDAEVRRLKARLASRIADLLGGTVSGAPGQEADPQGAAHRLGVPPGVLDAILRGRLRDVSVERLLACLHALGQDVTVHVRPARDGARGRTRVVARSGPGRPMFGALRGAGALADAFFDPLPEVELRAWEGAVEGELEAGAAHDALGGDGVAPAAEDAKR